jgi:hypothetical protein
MPFPLARSLLAAAGSACLALSACAGRDAGPGPGPLNMLEVTEAGAEFQVLFGAGDAAAGRQVARALAPAARRAQRYAPLTAPVTLTIHPSHEALEQAVDRPGYAWLRAWARARTVDLQSPRTWGFSWGVLPWSRRGRDAEVEELLVHELVHCAMYQAAGGEGGWALLDVPRWFSEGMASVTADQGYRRATLADLRRHWQQERESAGAGDGWSPDGTHTAPQRRGDPLLDPDPLYRERDDLVYGAAHHAFAALVERHGDPAVRRVIALLAAGQPFHEAFREVTGVSPAAFAAAFKAEVRDGPR